MSKQRQLTLWALLAAWGSLLLISGCGDSQSNASLEKVGPKPIAVEVMKIQPAPLYDVLTLPGGTEAAGDVLLAAERGGQVEWVGPREGERVKKGQLIAKIDVSALEAALDRARAEAKLAQNLAQRRKSLHKRGVLPQEELDRMLTDQVVAQGRLRETKVHYDQGFVRSPIDGVINKLFVDAGEFVDRGKPVADIVDASLIEVNVNVPEMDIRWLKKDQQAQITIDAFEGRKWTGQVDFVSYKADPATRTFMVRVVVDNSDGAIRPGMIARAFFLRRVIEDALSIPLFALLDKGGERVVFVEKDGVAQARTVALGVIQKDLIQITKGLKPGDNLIITGHTEVEEGSKVTTK